MTILRHSMTAYTAYQEMLRLLQDDAVTDIRGTPTLRKQKGRGYWYDRYRIGSSDVETYIGEDNETLRARLEQIERLKEQSAQRAKERTRLSRLLRAEGFLQVESSMGSLLSAFAKTGVFRLGGTLVGTHAFRLYEGELGVRIKLDELAVTNDVDIASFERLSIALDDKVLEPLTEIFEKFEFAPIPTIEAGRVWRWQQTRGMAQVEFLTPSFSDDEGLRELPALGVSAQSLHHLNYLLAGPIKAAAIYRSGVLVQIPAPERFAIHKLIVANRRQRGPDAPKALKDRRQAALWIKILHQDRPDELKEAYDEACALGPKWRERIDRTLKRLPESAELLNDLDS